MVGLPTPLGCELNKRQDSESSISRIVKEQSGDLEKAEGVGTSHSVTLKLSC